MEESCCDEISCSNIKFLLCFGVWEFMVSFAWIKHDDDSLFADIVLSAREILERGASLLKSISSEVGIIDSRSALIYSQRL